MSTRSCLTTVASGSRYEGITSENNPHLPKDGYFKSNLFKDFPNLDVGIKRYNFVKPDGNRTNVEVNVQLRHVIPIMKYVPRFKVNVPNE